MEPGGISGPAEPSSVGDTNTLETLVAAAYNELSGIASALMRGQLNGNILQPTALVNEAYLRLARSGNHWDSKAHFFGSAARAMRQVLVEHARHRSAQKRAGDAARVTFHDLEVETAEPQLNVIVLEEALAALSRVDERCARVMKLRYVDGCSLAEIAGLTGRSLATVKRDCLFARDWLYDFMST